MAEKTPLIDLHSNPIGDVVVASWIVHSAAAVGADVQLNPRNHHPLARLLGVPESSLTTEQAPDWSSTPGQGHHLEYHLACTTPRVSRFDAWCRSLNLPVLRPVRPNYREHADDGWWASQQWLLVDVDPSRPRVLLFPDAAWSIRAWPKAYFIDLASALIALGYAVAAMSGSQVNVEQMPCRWWSGFNLGAVAAMARRATVVVANESGPAHLASAIGARTIAICGPTDPAVIYAHEPNIEAVTLDPQVLPCVGCHFSNARGYRFACDVGGCQALMRLDPAHVVRMVQRAVLHQDATRAKAK